MFKPDCEEKDHWETPPNLHEARRTAYPKHLFYDPCPRYPVEDGLIIDWPLNAIAYVNPPYSRGRQLIWAKKCIEQDQRGVKILLLLPFDTSTKLFNEYLLPHCNIVHTFDKRIKFVGAPGSPNFDSALYLFDNQQLEVKREILIKPLKICEVDAGDKGGD